MGRMNGGSTIVEFWRDKDAATDDAARADDALLLKQAVLDLEDDGMPAESEGHGMRSEEHTSELQSLMRISYAVFCLKKKKIHPIDANLLHLTININVATLYTTNASATSIHIIR